MIMNADDILKKLGELGTYQKRLLFFLFIFSVVNSWPPLAVIFTHYEPEHHCKIANSFNATAADEGNINETTFLVESGDKIRNACTIFIQLEDQTSSCLDWVFDTENDGGETVVSQMNLVCDKDWILPFILSITFASGALGLVVCGILADRFGRRPIFLGVSLLTFVTTLGIAFSQDVIAYGTFLILTGALSSIQYAAMCVLGSEMIAPKYRNLVFLSISGGYITGYATLPLIAYVANDWHTMLYVISAGNCVYLFGYWYCPETLHWLLLRNDLKRAKKLITEIAKLNKCEVGQTEDFLMKNIIKDTENRNTKKPAKPNLTALLKSPTMRTRLLVTAIIWFTTNFVYYAITLNTSYLQGDRYINCLISALLEILSSCLGHLLMGRIGRVKTSFLFFFAAGIACISARLLSEVSLITVTILAVGGKTAITGAFYVIYVHAVEMTPTMNRNLFMNVCNAFSNIGSIISPYIMYLGRKNSSETIVYTFMGVSSLVAGVLTVLFLPETTGQPLPDTMEEAKKQKRIALCFQRNRRASLVAVKNENKMSSEERGPCEIAPISS